jgi:hypothetical protein
MIKRMMTAVSALALVATMVAPSTTLAKENESGSSKRLSKVSETTVLDMKGDDNGLSKFKKHSENRRLKNIEGVITAIVAPVAEPKADGTITVKKENGKSYTFTFDSTTSAKYTTFLRKYKGTATWNEIMVGDSVKVFASSLTNGKAIIVWDKGIWWTELKGTVSNLNVEGKAFTLTVTMKGVEMSTTVKMDSATAYLMKDGTVKTIADLTNGQTVKIRGAWNTVGKYLLAKKIVIYPATI